MRAQEYLDSLPGSEQRGVNKFLKGLGETLLPVRQTTVRGQSETVHRFDVQQMAFAHKQT